MAASRTRIYLLGPPRIERDGQAVDVDTRKAIALLAYLALAGATQRRSTLATLLWPDTDQSRARTALRRTLFVLGQAIGKEWLDADRQNVTLREGEALWIDVKAFRQQLFACIPQTDPTEAHCHRCLPLLEQATELYHGDLLEGFHLPDNIEFSEWHRFQAESVRHEYGQALQMLMRCHSQQGAFEAAISYGRRWIALDMLHEPAHRELMRVYTWAGQRSKALRQYETCVRVLADELGTKPAEETSALYQMILAGELQRWREADAHQFSGSSGDRRHNLPLATTAFIGRAAELDELQRLLDDPTCRLLTIVGPGGVGKTRLALELAWRYAAFEDAASPDRREPFAHGIYLVPLAPLGDGEFLAATVADALGYTFYGREDHRTQLLNYLREKQMLLILDNFEHVLEPGVALLQSILQGAPEVRLLVTSRERLNLQGECLLEIQGLACPSLSQPLHEQLEASAIQLFLQRARRVRPNFTPSEPEITAITRICRMLDGLPLGIELAAVWVRILSSEQIAAEIEKNLDFLSTSMRDVPLRHQSLRAVFEQSWNLLSAPEQAVFRKLAVFRGQFDHTAADEIAGATLPLLLALVDKSFLRREEPLERTAMTIRYTIPEVLHPYAEEKLAAAPGEAEATGRQHAAYYASFVEAQARRLKGEGQVQALVELSEVIENVRAAWRWTIEHNEQQLLGQFIENLYHFYEMRSWLQEGVEVFGRAVEQLQADSATLLLGKALSRQGRLLVRLAQYERAQATLQRALGILREQDVPHEVASVLSNMGIMAEVAGNLTQAEALQRETRAIFEQANDQWGIANSLLRLGNVAYAQGNYQEAWRFYEESLAIRNEIGDLRGIALCLNNLGSIVDTLGHYEEAKDLYRESVAMKRELGDRRGVAYSLNNLGYVNYLVGDYHAALTSLEECLAIFKEIGDQKGGAYALSNLANVAYALHEYEQAQELYEETLRIFHEIGDRAGMAFTLNHLADIKCAQGDHNGARSHYQEALKTAMSIRAFPIALDILVGVAALLVAEDNLVEALTLLEIVQNQPTGRKQTLDRALTLLETVRQQVDEQAKAVALRQAQAVTLEDAVARLIP